MDLKDLIARFTGAKAPRLAKVVLGSPCVELHRLQVHTAENTTIITVCPDTVEIIRKVAQDATPLTLTNGEMDVHLTPVHNHTLHVRDPKKGWIIPLDEPAREEILNKLDRKEDGYEINDQLAFIVEDLDC